MKRKETNMYYSNYYNKTIKEIDDTLTLAMKILAKLMLIKSSKADNPSAKYERAILLTKYTTEYLTVFDYGTRLLIKTINQISSGFNNYSLKELKTSKKHMEILGDFSKKYQDLNEIFRQKDLQSEIL